MQIDALDRDLLDLLSGNARMPTAEIARRLGLSRTTVQSRIERLERGGAILGYTIRPGRASGRDAVRAHVLIALASKRATSVESALRRMNPVRALYAVSGSFDLIAVVEANSVEETDRLIDRIGALDGVERTNSMLILSTRLSR
jgi:DNA-binding Lrp family transcriptional regulator